MIDVKDATITSLQQQLVQTDANIIVNKLEMKKLKKKTQATLIEMVVDHKNKMELVQFEHDEKEIDLQEQIHGKLTFFYF